MSTEWKCIQEEFPEKPGFVVILYKGDPCIAYVKGNEVSCEKLGLIFDIQNDLKSDLFTHWFYFSLPKGF